MKGRLVLTIVIAGLTGRAAGPNADFAAGRELYREGEFSKAVARFRLALKENPRDAQTYYWAGMSYQMLADIATPFGGRYSARAREYLRAAVTLAPDRADYRTALFDCVLDSASYSRSAVREAAEILLAVPDSDPAYGDMRLRLEYERKANSTAEARLGRLVLAVPRAAHRITAASYSALSAPAMTPPEPNH